MVTQAQAKSLRAQLHAAGVFNHSEARAWGKLFFCITVAAVAAAAIVLGPWWMVFISVPVMATFVTTAAMLGHEGSHRSISSSPRRNALMQHIAFPLLGGLGALHWRNKHDVQHHGHPNVRNHDPDVALWPMTSCQEDHLASNPLRRFIQRNIQGYIFWPLTLMLPFMMRISSFRRLVFHAKKHGMDRAFWTDTLSLVGHYVIWLVIPTLLWGPGAIAVYFATWATIGLMLSMIFAPAHIGLPIVVDQNCDWEHQLETTRNLRLPRWLSWFFVGLDYQVEHHLFPKIPHQHLPRASLIVQRWCAEVGLRHHTISYGPALVDVTTFLHNAWKTPATSGATVRSESEAYAQAVLPAKAALSAPVEVVVSSLLSAQQASAENQTSAA